MLQLQRSIRLKQKLRGDPPGFPEGEASRRQQQQRSLLSLGVLPRLLAPSFTADVEETEIAEAPLEEEGFQGYYSP